MIIGILVFILLAVAYISLIMPRLVSRADMSGLCEDYAHRGLHGGDCPENSVGAFKRAVEKGYGIELDVQLSKDGVPMVFHDDTLDRVCGVRGRLCDFTCEELTAMPLCGSEYTVPTLCEVLDLVDGRVPLLIELKTGNPMLCPTVAPMLDEYRGIFCIESFDPRLLSWVKKFRPQYARGQLVGRSIKEKHTGSFVLNAVLVSLISHVLSRPDFVACDIKMKGNPSVFLCRKLFKVPVFGWTVRSAEEYEFCRERSMRAIFENIEP